MALADFAPSHRFIQSPLDCFITATQQWLARRRAERTQHAALQSLLFAPEHRLRDLGILREELIQAMEIHRK